MIKYIIITLFIIFSTEATFSQTDTLNQLNPDNKKMGWWITYLDDNLELLEDSVGATHYMYNYFWENIHLYRYGEGYGSKKYPIHFPVNETLKIGDYILLDGEYKTIFKNGNVRSVLSASQGILIEFKMYYPEGQLKFEIIYSAECGAPKQHCIRQYKKDGELKFDGFTWLPANAKTTND